MAADSYRILCRFFIGIISIIAAAAAVTALTVVILASHLTRLTCHVTYASLEFNFTPHNTINYEIAFTIAVQNPNKYYNVEHDEVSVMIYYKGQRYGSVDLNSFHQRTKSTADLTPSFKGQIGLDEFFKLNFSGNAGTYGVVAVKVHLRNEYSLSIAKFVRKKKVESNFTCELKMPTISYINRQSANISVPMPTYCN